MAPRASRDRAVTRVCAEAATAGFIARLKSTSVLHRLVETGALAWTELDLSLVRVPRASSEQCAKQTSTNALPIHVATEAPA